MKKTIAMILSFTILFCLCACNNDGSQIPDSSNSSQAATNSTESSKGSTEMTTDGTEGTTAPAEDEAIKEIVLPASTSKLGKDLDYKSSSTACYINVDGMSNRPKIESWGNVIVVDGVADYLDYLETLGFTVEITSSTMKEPYSGFYTHETNFRVSNEHISWTMCLFIQEEKYVEYQFDINLVISSTTEESTSVPTEGSNTVTTETPTAPSTQPPATEPPVTEAPTTKPPTTEPPVTETSDYAAMTAKYSGRWYLQGYSDIYIDIARLGIIEAMNIEATGISLPGDVVTSTSYTLYPALIDGYDGWYHAIEIPFSTWNEWLTKKQISLNDTYITLGSRTFVRAAGTKDKYTGKFCKAALGTWYLDKNPDVQIVISVVGGNEYDGDYYGIDTQNLDLSTLQYTKNDYCTITAAKTSDWTNLGISVSNNTLTISNSYGTKIFYREPTYPTEPPATESPATEPPATESPATEPPTTEPPATEPPTTEPASDVLIISNAQTISNQTINTDVYITSTGVVTFKNVTVNGNVYCYGKLTVSGGSANNLYAYYWDLGGIVSSCDAWDGTHGLVKGAFSSCGNVIIKDNALDYAFNKWGKK